MNMLEGPWVDVVETEAGTIRWESGYRLVTFITRDSHDAYAVLLRTNGTFRLVSIDRIRVTGYVQS